HLRELRLDRAERGDRPAELMPLVGVAHSLSNHQLHAARTHRAEFEAPEVQDVESDLRALADLAQEILDGRRHIREHERRRARTLNTHLVLFRAARQTRLPLDDEAAELV